MEFRQQIATFAAGLGIGVACMYFGREKTSGKAQQRSPKASSDRSALSKVVKYRLVFLGFGNVMRAFTKMLLDKRDVLREEHGIEFEVVAIITARHGFAIANPQEHLDLEQISSLAGDSDYTFFNIHRDSSIGLNVQDWTGSDEQVMELISQVGGSSNGSTVLFEGIPVSYDDGQPALSYLAHGLRCGMHVISANKGPVVHGHDRLMQLAKMMQNNDSKNSSSNSTDVGGKLYYGHESAVMDGIPVFNLHRHCLPGARVTKVRGILNSTTNIILSGMEEGRSYEDCLNQAQNEGIAEADPTGDVDGWDAAVKLVALAAVVLKPNSSSSSAAASLQGKPQNAGLTLKQVSVQGIRGVTKEMLDAAKGRGNRIKLVCEVQVAARGDPDQTLKASVRPAEVEATDEL